MQDMYYYYVTLIMQALLVTKDFVRVCTYTKKVNNLVQVIHVVR